MGLNPAQAALAAALRVYRPADAREEGFRRHILAQVEATPLWWHRDTLPGHVTASAFVADPALDHLLLHHHRKLDRWLQLGGHDEGEQAPERTAVREVAEESGLTAVEFFGGAPAIFDLDVHAIPARGGTPAHDHLDVRFLLLADPTVPLRRLDAESQDLRWFPLAEALERLGEEGARRVGCKIAALPRTRSGYSRRP